VLAEPRKTQTRTVRVSLHPPLATAALTCRALCHTRLRHGPPAPWGKVLHVVSFYFQIYWWCWDGQAPRKRRLRCNTKQCSLVSCGFSLWRPPSFRDVATPTRHPRENLPGETSSHPIPQSTHRYTHKYISVCVCACVCISIDIKRSRSCRAGRRIWV